MIILSIETGTDICSVALSSDDKLLSLRESDGTEGRNHASDLGVYIDEILREGGYEPSDLDAIAVSKGPGSYTGLRIGVSTAKGLCYALQIPLIAIGSLNSLANVAAEDYRAKILGIDNWERAKLCPMIDARRMEVYAQVFDSALNPLTDVEAHIVEAESFGNFIDVEKSEESGEFVLFGNGAAKCLDILPKNGVRFVDVTPSARGLVAPAFEAFQKGQFEDIAYFEPLYLKDFVVIPSKKKMF